MAAKKEALILHKRFPGIQQCITNMTRIMLNFLHYLLRLEDLFFGIKQKSKTNIRGGLPSLHENVRHAFILNYCTSTIQHAIITFYKKIYGIYTSIDPSNNKYLMYWLTSRLSN